LRLSLDPCEPPGDAWRALALRSGATAAADLAALDHALAAQQRDGVQRVVELAPASLRERGFAEAVTLRLVVHPVRAVAHAPVLAWRSTPDGADPLAEAWQSACAAWLAAGARLAARHAGGPLVALDTWRDAGVTAVVVDGALLARVALDDAARAHAFGMAALLRDAGLEAWADGVRDERDRAVLPSLGFRRVAGP
jgi:EAL domain-containing protein (putative c-di-GMP-specific phosphodiesterase class I)